ncbi:MAG: lipoyl-dependent peroxiredoxin, partial [Thermoleophilales bacterium]|nr:lipoyl-dependent peroxiredoxin [Thermoleophilales bacterium]
MADRRDAIYTAEAHVTGGRAEGHGRTSDGALEVDIRVPEAMGGSGGGTNPEQLFAVGWATCFESALGTVARRRRQSAGDVAIDSRVMLVPNEDRGFSLVVITANGRDIGQATGAAPADRSAPPDRRWDGMIGRVTATATAAEIAAERVAAARATPIQRLELAARSFDCGLSPADAWSRFARSELAFLRHEIARGVLAHSDAERPGSPWWRAVNERLLHDTAEATLLVQGYAGPPSSRSVELWLA